jgi:hypothetical protein
MALIRWLGSVPESKTRGADDDLITRFKTDRPGQSQERSIRAAQVFHLDCAILQHQAGMAARDVWVGGQGDVALAALADGEPARLNRQRAGTLPGNRKDEL